MKVKILFVLLTISLAINAVIFYGLSKYDLVEKGSTQLPNTSLAADSLKLTENKVDIEAKVKSGYGYIYSLTDDQIMKAINEGKKDGAYFGEDFKLPLLSSTSNDSTFEYRDVFINTPYRFVAIHSSNQYTKYDRTSSIEEVWKFISYDHISFSAYVMRGWAKMLAIEMIQEGRIIQPYKTENNANGDMKSVNFSVNDIDFREPASLKIFEKSNPEKYAEYKIAFEDYVK
ncbi:hypothetical protein [Paenibacillus borealis]|uniref:Uncharacterized protein n=1 Tax=Paenibacillus borealis TaxID=160799 RepID=A0A089LEK0_PAEBO|nr:hypothetical protein [Paenibacillus borealis]AIQ59287.1 hypothetical protein PBOR_21820 [Paenibacillus borealis]